jgi:Kef-type K+ transport system membrane component KefB
MPAAVTSLFWISVCAVVAPLLAGLVPRKLLPEVVLLLGGGILIGPSVLELAGTDEAIDMLRNLGLGMLFLLAGYEIELKELTGHQGRRAMWTWLTCLALAFVTVEVVGLTGAIHDELAVAIALTSTALGTLLPILKDTAMLSTPMGDVIVRHGAFGELGPVVAMAILLGTRGPVVSLIILVVFALIAVVVSLPSAWARRESSRIVDLIRAGSETTGQTTVRLTMLLLVTLGAVAVAFHLDIVLGAFAAGFILRRALPGGDERLESKLDGLAFGFLIPIFFVTSGMAIDPSAVAEEPLVLVIFILLILVLRGGPVFLATLYDRTPGGPSFGVRDSLRVGLFASTGLPIIVAVTSLAVSEGEMSTVNASVLVAGGALTVLMFPLLATILPAEETAERRS